MARSDSGLVPLDLALVEGGRFLSAGNAALVRAQEEIVAAVAQYGRLGAEKAKARVTLELTIGAPLADDADGKYRLMTRVKLSLPGRPQLRSYAVEATGRGGAVRLAVRPEGSDVDNPRQGRLPAESDTGKAVRKSA